MSDWTGTTQLHAAFRGRWIGLTSTNCSDNFASAVDLLASRAVYPDHPDRVEVLETYISWIFLTDRHAYKIKKPVHYGAINYSSSKLRRQACVDELRLNSRLASRVYQLVQPITRTKSGKMSLDGDGIPVDWVIRMRRLSETRNLQGLMESGRIQVDDTRALASTLSQFYLNRPPETVRMEVFCERLADNIQANQSILANGVEPADCEMIRSIHATQFRFLASAARLLDERVVDGRIVDGHGDLRPEHIYLEHHPVVIDCIEYDNSLRQVDAVDDLCCLRMECQRLGHPEVGDEVMAQYKRNASDRVPEQLCLFYMCYRACVRAKVASIRGSQLGRSSPGRAAIASQQRQYLQLARQYASELEVE
jgi:uncharacterized protein